MSDFILERPPREASAKAAEFVAFLDANVGQWAALGSFPSSSIAKHRCKRLRRRYESQGYDFVSRNTPKGHTVYGIKRPPKLAFTHLP
jgi:hypothetical protein